MEESVVGEEDEGVFGDEVEASEATEFLITPTKGLREGSVIGKTDGEVRLEEYVETNPVSDAEARDRDGDGYGRLGGET